jgi:hypothetical protein
MGRKTSPRFHEIPLSRIGDLVITNHLYDLTGDKKSRVQTH